MQKLFFDFSCRYDISDLVCITGFVLGLIITSRKPELIARSIPDFKFSLYSKPGSQKFELKSNQLSLIYFDLKSIFFLTFVLIFFLEIFSTTPLLLIKIFT